MLQRKLTKTRLNIDSGNTGKILPKTTKKHEKVESDLDKILSQTVGKTSTKSMAISSLNESNEFINEISSNLFSKLGIVTVNGDIGGASNSSLVRRVNQYLTRFPEIEYLIDMLASSIIYTSSSNTKKIQVSLNGEHKTIVKEHTVKSNDQSDTTASDTTTADVEVGKQPTAVEIEQVTFNENVETVDSYYRDISIEIGNLFKKNNIKLSLYNLMFSILKFGCGIFYIDDITKFDSVSFYGLDEVEFIQKQKKKDHAEIKSHLFADNEDHHDGNIFTSTEDDDHIKKLKGASVSVIRLEDGVELKRNQLFFIAEKGIFGKSLVDKVISYLKVIELLELSLLIERLSKSKTQHIWKLDLSKIEEEDVASTLMLYRNMMKSKNSMSYDEDTDSMSFDIIKNLVDSNLLVPTEDDNLKIDTLKSEFKPLLDDIDYWWDKVYHTMGIPTHYRKGTSSKAYLNNNMLSLHDNVYSMKIRHWQVIINNILTFWIEKWLDNNYRDLTIKFLNVNVPEFVPISERKETDLDKGSKFVTMFTQVEQMLGINIKDEFILNKLFPNDIMSDIIDTSVDESDLSEEDIIENDDEENEEDILGLFESGLNRLANQSKPKIQKKRANLWRKKETGLPKNYRVYGWKIKMDVDW